MRADELGQHDLVRIINVNHEAVIVAADIEDHAVVANEIRRVELGPDIGRTVPVGLSDRVEPGG